MRKRIVLTSALAGAIVCALAAPAAAHVTVDPPSAPQGRDGRSSRSSSRTRSPTATVTEVQIAFPTPPADADPDRHRRGEAGLERHGDDADARQADRHRRRHHRRRSCSAIDWKAKTARRRASRTDEFGEFTIDADGLPDRREPGRVQGDPDLLGRQGRALDRPGHARAGPRPSNPTPILQLTNPNGTATPTTTAPARARPRPRPRRPRTTTHARTGDHRDRVGRGRARRGDRSHSCAGAAPRVPRYAATSTVLPSDAPAAGRRRELLQQRRVGVERVGLHGRGQRRQVGQASEPLPPSELSSTDSSAVDAGSAACTAGDGCAAASEVLAAGDWAPAAGSASRPAATPMRRDRRCSPALV